MAEKRKSSCLLLDNNESETFNEGGNKRTRPLRSCRLRVSAPPEGRKTPQPKNGKKQAEKSALHNLPDAVRNGNLELAKKILSARKTIVKKSLSKPLLGAVRDGNTDIVKLLLKYGADPSYKGVVNLAIQTKNYTMVQYLLEYGANPNTPCKQNSQGSAFHAVALHLNQDIRLAKKVLKLLSTLDCNIQQVDNKGRCPFAVACQVADTDLMSLFLLHGANVNKPAKSSYIAGYNMHVAHRPRRRYGNGSTAIYSSGFTPLHRMVQTQPSTKKLNFLLQNGADVNARDSLDYTPLMRCVQSRRVMNVEYCKILLQHGSDPNAVSSVDGTCPIYLALRNSREVVETLLDVGAHGNAVYNDGDYAVTPLMCALEKNYPDKSAEILIARTDRNHINMRGKYKLETALNMAISKGLEDNLVSKLLDAGADPNISNQAGMTPLALAAEKGHMSTVKILLLGGASSNPSRMPLESATACSSLTTSELMTIQEPVCCAAAYDEKNIMNVLFSAGFGISESAKKEKLPHFEKETLNIAKAHLTQVKPLMELCRITTWTAFSPMNQYIKDFGLPKAMELFIALEDYSC